MGPPVYIVAVSGGVDSIVLLHKLMAVKPDKIKYVVAHVDHGIRSDSDKDAKFVKELAKGYGLEFELKKLHLGKKASEDLARGERYDFLFNIMKKHKAEAVITAHHQDDVLETMIVNVLRGTSPRGLIGFTRRGILRPLIHKTKRELQDYAKEQNLKWHEDSTNEDTAYLRNYVRKYITPKLDLGMREELLSLRSSVEKNYTEIDNLSAKLLVSCIKKSELVRSRFVLLPYIVQLELAASWLRLNGVEFDRSTLQRIVLSIKTLQPGKHIELNKQAKLFSQSKTFVLKVDMPHV